MYHHDHRDYKVASSQAAVRGREKMEAIIAKGRANAQAVAEQVQNQVPIDRIAKADRIRIAANGDGFSMLLNGVDPTRIHEHALGQVASKAGLDAGYLKALRDPGRKEWGPGLAEHNFNELLKHSDSRHLIRVIGNDKGPEVRGFLSDRFRRLDSRPLLDAFMGACSKVGAVPVEGYALDTKVKMRAVLPYVFEPVENEVMLFGAEWGNSDFGDGGHCVRLFNTRVWCTNTAVLDEALRQVHLGKRLDDNIAYSARTYELDNATNASALRDVVLDVLGPDRVNGYLEHIKEAVALKVDEKDVTRILKQRFGKGDAEKIQALYEGPDVQNLPPGNTMYRLSNAVSFFSQTEGISRAKQLDLQEAAGGLLPAMGAGKPKEV